MPEVEYDSKSKWHPATISGYTVYRRLAVLAVESYILCSYLAT